MNKIFGVIPRLDRGIHVFIMLIFASTAFAETSKQLIYFDFEKLAVSSHGVYMPSSNGKHSVDVIKAEVAARANGIDNITKYLNESCKDINTPALRTQPKFETLFRSQGTEIFANGALKINLVASYKSVFQYKEPTNLLAEDSQPIVFSLPSAIPAHALKCGSPVLEFINNSNQTMHIQIIPARSKNTIAAKEKLVKLVYNEQKKALIVANQQDALILRTANFTFDKDGTTFLPVVVYSKSVVQN